LYASVLKSAQGDILVTATGNIDVITIDHMRHMKYRAIVCNIGHFDSEIQIDALRNYLWEEVKPQVDEVVFPDGKRLIVLAKGRLVSLGCATGHPSFVMSASFTNQVLAQIELFTNHGQYENKVYILPKHLDEKVATLHLEKLGAKLTTLSAAQANFLNLPRSGPFKPEHHRYSTASATAVRPPTSPIRNSTTATPRAGLDAEHTIASATLAPHISTSAPSSMTRSGGMRRNSAGRAVMRTRPE
jgi:hypothetical protein